MIRDNFPTSLIDDHLDQLRGKRIFNCLNLKNGFYYVKVAIFSIKYMAFITPLGQFEYLKMPFGLINACQIFQRYIYKIFKPMITKNEVLIYMDDILIATEGLEEHFNTSCEVFESHEDITLSFN